MTLQLDRRDLEFLLYDLLGVDALTARPRFAGQGREVWDAVLDTARGIADEHYAPFRKANDQEEPQLVDGRVVTTPGLKQGWDAVAESGLIAATHDESRGGMQLPHVLASAAIAHLEAANIGSASYPMLTAGAANLIAAFGSAEQQARWLPAMLTGRWSGTMALTEPDAGSSLADLRTRATPQPDGTYHLEGTKIWISGGDHGLTENIVHLVLARIDGAPAGTKGISLFIVPKRRVRGDGTLDGPNQVTVAGLIHKMGWRGTTSTLLNFGERGPCVGELVGAPHHGLAYMFHMMNEARIGVGRAATAMGCAAYRYSLAYARTRRQGRTPGEKDPARPPVAIIEHADVRRMLLQQKAAAEGSLALILQCALLVDEQGTAPDPAAREHATRLLEVLTPIAKTWPAIACQEGISNAVQVLGGYGYAREYDVEQLYRDNRLNQIHEGTNGIQALDLLGRKMTQQQGACLRALVQEFDRAADEVAHAGAPLAPLAAQLREASARLVAVTQHLVGAMAADPARGLAHATLYLELASRTVYAWLWLRQATRAARALDAGAAGDAEAFHRGKLQAARYHFGVELPRTVTDAGILTGGEASAFEMRPEWFG